MEPDFIVGTLWAGWAVSRLAVRRASHVAGRMSRLGVRLSAGMQSAAGPDPAMGALAMSPAVSGLPGATWVGRKVGHLAGHLLYRVPEVLGLFLLLSSLAANREIPSRWATGIHPMFGGHLWSAGPGLAWSMALLCIAGFAFAAWAGLHRAMLWSGGLTGREGLQVIDTGPFSVVRHPVSAGLLLAAAATMVMIGTGEAVAGTGLLLAGFALKALQDERVLRRQLGADTYRAYTRRTPMLVPFAKR
ncbi:MAG TPA: hypothetical protein VGG10_01930 [Rhizomicrobium sp.]|jgi:protein-S-isoprenylcysteine O-methyltransferase Ste14